MRNAAWFLCYGCGFHATEGYWLDIDGEESTFYCKACAEAAIADGTLQREWLREQPEVSEDWGMKEEETVLKGIMKVAQEVTDFDSGFDRLFGFMAANPESRTTKDFIDFHINEMNAPTLESGDPNFSYLVGKEFTAEHWVHTDDMDAFQAYVKKRDQ